MADPETIKLAEYVRRNRDKFFQTILDDQDVKIAQHILLHACGRCAEDRGHWFHTPCPDPTQCKAPQDHHDFRQRIF